MVGRERVTALVMLVITGALSFNDAPNEPVCAKGAKRDAYIKE